MIFYACKIDDYYLRELKNYVYLFLLKRHRRKVCYSKQFINLFGTLFKKAISV